jgi:hypothetical protein
MFRCIQVFAESNISFQEKIQIIFTSPSERAKYFEHFESWKRNGLWKSDYYVTIRDNVIAVAIRAPPVQKPLISESSSQR